MHISPLLPRDGASFVIKSPSKIVSPSDKSFDRSFHEASTLAELQEYPLLRKSSESGYLMNSDRHQQNLLRVSGSGMLSSLSSSCDVHHDVADVSSDSDNAIEVYSSAIVEAGFFPFMEFPALQFLANPM